MSKNQDKNKQEQTAKEAAEAPEIMDVVDTEENETKAEEAELDEKRPPTERTRCRPRRNRKGKERIPVLDGRFR